MRARLSTTLRIAIIASLCALAANSILVAYIRYATSNSTLVDLRARVIEDAALLRTATRSQSPGDAARTVAAGLAADDPDALAAISDRKGHVVAGRFPGRLPPAVLSAKGYQIVPLSSTAGDGREAGVIVMPLPSGGYLVSGRILGEAPAIQRALEQTIFLAALLSIVLGLLVGIAVAAFVGARVRDMSRIVDGIGHGDFSARLPIIQGRDSFDRLANRINLMLDRIAVLMAEIRVLTDSLAHDLRSPIGRLRSKIERARELNGDQGGLLASALQDADALNQLLTTTLEIGRAEAMTGTARFEPFDLAAMAAGLVELYEPMAEDIGAALNLDVPGQPVMVFAHRQLMIQAVGNLIDNALVHAGHGIEVVVRHESGSIQIGVLDRGPGIAEALHPLAKRRFGRLDTARTTPGAGLGLSLVEAVAHLHGGTLILADNAPGLQAMLDIPDRQPGPDHRHLPQAV